MIFKSFSTISRHAALAKQLWQQGNTSTTQPAGAFFYSTNQLGRHQNSQLARRASEHSATNNNNHSGINTVSTTFPGVSQFSTLDDDRQNEIIGNGAAGSTGVIGGANGTLYNNNNSANTNNVIYNQQRSLVRPSFRRHYSTGTRDVGSRREDVMERRASESNKKVILGGVSVDEMAVEEEAELEMALVDRDAQMESTESSEQVAADQQRLQEQMQQEAQFKNHQQPQELHDSQIETPSVEVGQPKESAIESAQSIDPLVAAFNETLQGLRKIKDVSGVLDTYSQMLAQRVVPSTQTYTIVLLALAEAAQVPIDRHLAYLKRRHGSQVAGPEMYLIDQVELAESYAGLALDVYEASVSVVERSYDNKVYQALAETCGRFRKLSGRARKLPRAESSLSSSSLATRPLLAAYAKAGEVEQVIDILQKEDNKNKYGVGPLIEAYVNNKDVDSAILLVRQVLDKNEQDSVLGRKEFEASVLGPLIIGLARIGECKRAWRWIQEADADPRVHALSASTLAETMSQIARHGKVKVVRALFDFIASRTDIPSQLLDESRADYAMACVRNNSLDDLYKVVQETQLRGGKWDATTVVAVTEFLVELAKVPLAIDVVSMQMARIDTSGEKSSQQHHKYALLSGLIASLSSHGHFTADTAFGLLRQLGEELPPQAFLDGCGGAVQIFEVLAQSSYASDPLVVNLACSRIEALPYSEMLDSLAVSASELDEVRQLMQEVVDRVEHVNQRLVDCCKRIGLEISPENKTAPQGLSDNMYGDPFNTASSHIIAYARTPYGLDEAAKCLHDALARGERVSGDAFLHVMEASYRENVPELAVETYDLALRHVDIEELLSKTFCGIIGVTAPFDFALAHQVYMQLRSYGRFPDAEGYTSLATHWARQDDEAQDILMLLSEAKQHLTKLTTNLYNAVLGRLARARKLKDISRLFDEMDHLGLVKNTTTFGHMISAYCRSGDAQTAENIFSQMEQDIKQFEPRANLYNMLMQCYVSCGDKRKALLTFDRLRESGLMPTAHTYKLLIDAHGLEPRTEEDLDNADRVLLQIKKDRAVAGPEHFAALLYLRGVVFGDFAAADEFYTALVKNRRVRPDASIFQALLETYVVNGYVKETPKVLQDMVKYGIDMDAHMANVLIRGWAQVSIEKSIGLFDYVLNSGLAEPSSYEAIVRAFIYHGDVDSAGNVVGLMKMNRYPDAVVHKVEAILTESSVGAAAASGRSQAQKSILVDSVFRRNKLML